MTITSPTIERACPSGTRISDVSKAMVYILSFIIILVHRLLLHEYHPNSQKLQITIKLLNIIDGSRHGLKIIVIDIIYRLE